MRGAVPIVFATYPILAGVDKASVIFNIVFFISFTSLLIQGTSLVQMARWLNVVDPEEEGVPDKEIEPALSERLEIELPAESEWHGNKIVDIEFPSNTCIISINYPGFDQHPQKSLA